MWLENPGTKWKIIELNRSIAGGFSKPRLITRGYMMNELAMCQVFVAQHWVAQLIPNTNKKSSKQLHIWRFPKIGVSPNHPL